MLLENLGSGLSQTQPTEDDELKGEVVGTSLMYTLADYHDQLWVGTSDGLSSFAKEPGNVTRSVNHTGQPLKRSTVFCRPKNMVCLLH